jgi:hypothetical protein
MTFLNEDYQAPKSNHYFKPASGDSKVRILSKPILGWIDWDDKKPIRYKYSVKAPKPVVEAKPCKHFWAFIVWNYQENKIQIWEVTQATIRADLEKMSRDEDLGPIFFYDIKINKTGEMTKTKYTLTALPPKQLAPHIRESYEETPCRLDDLFEGKNPFESEEDPTKGIFGPNDLKVSVFASPKPAAGGTLATLAEELVADKISTEHLETYLNERASEKSVSIEQVIGGALLKEVLPKFKRAFVKWLSERGEEEAIPF